MNEPEKIAILAAILAGKAIQDERENIHPSAADYVSIPYYVDLAIMFEEAVEASL